MVKEVRDVAILRRTKQRNAATARGNAALKRTRTRKAAKLEQIVAVALNLQLFVVAAELVVQRRMLKG